MLTKIRILEQKGYVKHRQEGRAFVYWTCVAEAEASRSEIRHMVQRFFGNSRERLLLSLLEDEEIAPEELERAMTLEMSRAFTGIFKKLGFHYVTLDLEGYRQGSLNAVLS